MSPRPRLLHLRAAVLAVVAAGLALPAAGQISLSTAVNLALKNNVKVRIAEADLLKARAVLAQTREVFVPAVSATGGIGKSTGAPLEPPVVFSIAAQSLVYNVSQADFIRAARAGVDSATLALVAAQSDAVEDATSAYIALDNALERRSIQQGASVAANRLVSISEDRFSAGVDPHIEVTRAQHTAAQIDLQALLVDDEIANNAEHLANLTGLTARGLTTVHGSIPALTPPAPAGPEAATVPQQFTGISAAFAAARAKQYTAHGERRYLLRPQVAFSAGYSRISTVFTTYTQYYPGFGAAGNSFNSLSFGVGITVPILDMARRARAREAAADAAHSLYEAQSQQMQFLEGRSKLRHSAQEFAARRHLAELDRDMAQDQLDTVLLRLKASAGAAGGEQLSPKDEQNARLQVQLRTLDMLSAELQLEQSEVTLMRQEGSLSGFLAAAIPSAVAAPAAASPVPGAPTPATIGTPQGTTPPAGTVPLSVPTTGTQPSTSPTQTPSTSTPQTPSPGVPHP